MNNKLLSYVGVFVLGFIACAWAFNFFLVKPSQYKLQNAADVSRGAPISLKSGSGESANAFRDAASKVRKYVVNIDTVGRPQVQPGMDYFFGFPFGGQPQEVVPKGQGSGVVIRPDGYIVTNNHVAAGATSLTVTLTNGNKYPAKLIGRDPKSDIAVIKINANDLDYAEFGNSNTLQPGDWVIAVGSPLGFESTVTVGVVSATKRGPININGEVLAQVIQTDAAINPGNSGGALADINGSLVGINTAIASTSGGSVGIGFAIPSKTAEKIADEIIKHGKVVHPWLGISYMPLNKETRDFLNKRGVKDLPKEDGAIVRDVYQGSPAETAGLQPQDVIIKINGKPVTGSNEAKRGEVTISDTVECAKVGQRVTMDVWHASNGRISKIAVTIGEMPADFGNPQQ